LKRTVALLVAPIAALALIAPTHAFGTPDAKVVAKNLPSTGQVATALGAEGPYARDLRRSRVVEIPTGCTTHKTVKATSALTGVYQSSTAVDPTVVAGVARMKSARVAKKVLAGQVNYPKICRSFETYGLKATVKKRKAPKLGNGAAFYTVVMGDSGVEVITVRKKATIISVSVSRGNSVTAAKVVQLAKQAVKRA